MKSTLCKWDIAYPVQKKKSGHLLGSLWMELSKNRLIIRYYVLKTNNNK